MWLAGSSWWRWLLSWWLRVMSRLQLGFVWRGRGQCRGECRGQYRGRRWMSRVAIVVCGVCEAGRGGCKRFGIWLTSLEEVVFQELACQRRGVVFTFMQTCAFVMCLCKRRSLRFRQLLLYRSNLTSFILPQPRWLLTG